MIVGQSRWEAPANRAVRQHFSYEAGNLTASDNTPCTSEQDSVFEQVARMSALKRQQSHPRKSAETRMGQVSVPVGSLSE